VPGGARGARGVRLAARPSEARASCAPVSARLDRIQADLSGERERAPETPKPAERRGFRLNGAAQESNLPSRGLHDRTGLKVRAGRSGGFVSAVLSHPRFGHVTSVRVRWVEGSTSSGD
jgi:hypothetical protein